MLVEEDVKRLLPKQAVTKDRIVQSWFRFVHLLGNPVDLCHARAPPNLVSPANELEQLVALGAGAVTAALAPGPVPGSASSQEQFMQVLQVHHAAIYHRAMTAVAIVVDLFLGRYRVPAIAPKKSVSFDTSPLPVSLCCTLHYITLQYS